VIGSYIVTVDDERYLVLLEEEGSMSSRGQNLPWSEACEIAAALRIDGAQISIHRVRGDDIHCVVAPDEPLDLLVTAGGESSG